MTNSVRKRKKRKRKEAEYRPFLQRPEHGQDPEKEKEIFSKKLSSKKAGTKVTPRRSIPEGQQSAHDG